MNKAETVLVGLSGGVDSSVAAALLKEQGYTVVGITMEIFDGSPDMTQSGRHACYGPGETEDTLSAQKAGKHLGIDFHVIDLREEYKKHVLNYFREEYLSGRTPNPCVVCNHRLKFGFLLDKAKKAGIDFDFFATGHYAQTQKTGQNYFLKKAKDKVKDQTYFLYALGQKQLARTMFPLGKYIKKQVRQLAREYGLETATRLESQDFVDGGDYSTLFEGIEPEAGPIVDADGTVLGKHKGIIHYTVGQRRGLGISSPRPLYVSGINSHTNAITVSDKAGLYSDGLIASNFHFAAKDKPKTPRRVEAKIRFRHNAAKAVVSVVGPDSVKITFDEPQLSVTPGQAAVLYENDLVFGGGIIDQAF